MSLAGSLSIIAIPVVALKTSGVDSQRPKTIEFLVKGEGVDAAMHGIGAKLRAIPLSTSTTLGPVPISRPWVLFIQSTPFWFMKKSA